jgi:5-methylcytosine-specific restriction endonuclease McrBC regulatory subunit McrC
VTEIGRAEYQVGQKTTRQSRGREGESIAQVVTESLNAESKKARNRSMLDLQSGNYDLTKVQDSRTITTLIETAGKQVTGALRKTQERQMQTWTSWWSTAPSSTANARRAQLLEQSPVK